ncbi:hypothetical protein BaRGS_00000584, partial [Batillaria attramentaria]
MPYAIAYDSITLSSAYSGQTQVFESRYNSATAGCLTLQFLLTSLRLCEDTTTQCRSIRDDTNESDVNVSKQFCVKVSPATRSKVIQLPVTTHKRRLGPALTLTTRSVFGADDNLPRCVREVLTRRTDYYVTAPWRQSDSWTFTGLGQTAELTACGLGGPALEREETPRGRSSSDFDREVGHGKIGPPGSQESSATERRSLH